MRNIANTAEIFKKNRKTAMESICMESIQAIYEFAKSMPL